MSAIAGIYHLNNEPINLEHGNRMMKELEKYPADDIQTWHNDKVFLGCHAQWITPESLGEKLPYYDHDRKLAITADAIIDNREELFERLQVDKRKRKEITDSELILLSYHKWGEDSPKYLIGDFAFMIWDERKQKLFGARDFSGSRTLYFFRNHQRFAFCTVISPLSKIPFVENNLNEQWLAEYIAHPGMIESINPFSTVYKDIEQLAPSHSITITDGRVIFSKYNKIELNTKLHFKSDYEYEEAFRDVYNKAITARLRTFRNIGAHLSGGLDSGSVTGFAAKSLRENNKKLFTYSYVPLENFIDWTPKYRIADETPFIESTVQHVQNIIPHYLSFDGLSPYSEVDDWLDILEMPYKFFENSFWLKGIYEQANEHGIGVLLNGARGNYSVSWGHALDYYSILLKKAKWLRLYREINLYSKNKGVSKKRIMSIIRKKAFPNLYRDTQSKTDYQFPMMIHSGFAEKTQIINTLENYGVDITGSAITNVFDARKKQFIHPEIWSINGVVSTKLSLRYSLWNRDPTNDLRVVQFCLSVPEEQFVQNGLDRSLIRRATVNILPEDVRLNHRIRGIQGADGVYRMFPYWNKFIDELQQLCKDPNVSEYFNVPVIKDLVLKIKDNPKEEYIFHIDFKVLMRSLIIYRFIKKYA
ncbi:asparagine synthase-related protein [Neobacillus drentensis]|uniref:asparagine synthase-related protein n=1 Tax=Neobacillus drentensis TaxID=220684 RepID=UPI00300009AF